MPPRPAVRSFLNDGALSANENSDRLPFTYPVQVVRRFPLGGGPGTFSGQHLKRSSNSAPGEAVVRPSPVAPVGSRADTRSDTVVHCDRESISGGQALALQLIQ